MNVSVGDTVNWSWAPPTGISGVSFQVVQVDGATGFSSIGFTSGDPTPTGSFSYQFNQAGTYYYWSGLVETSGQISFRGIIQVSDSSDKELELSVTLNGYSAQKCSFPFTYNSNNYSQCTNTDFGYNWCSPSATYTNQALKCDSLGEFLFIL